ncbi:Zn(2)-C6 fungal-type domain-containing protein [Mycena sanguinolenta]|uniref:Zn(2)-C6 fungal-type domain-containing protein n=1 Tax=Mycena sanguinolenta TaxID=230812 RepID=A0A8H6YVE3_9AGAR|nr:Zn(2)-C6 fungal-type domain-containing protein [Mycena sanguinolenta]
MQCAVVWRKRRKALSRRLCARKPDRGSSDNACLSVPPTPFQSQPTPLNSVRSHWIPSPHNRLSKTSSIQVKPWEMKHSSIQTLEPPTMSASARKDHCNFLTIHPVPSGISKEEYERKHSTWLDAVAQTPVAQRNMLKITTFIQQDTLTESIGRLDLPTASPTVVTHIVFEDVENFKVVARDATFKALVDQAKEFGYHKGASLFTADVVTKLDDVESGSQERKHAIGIFKIPPGLPKDKFEQKVDSLIDGAMVMPLAREKLLNYTIWYQNSEVDTEVEGLRLQTAAPLVVAMAEFETFNHVAELIGDPAMAQYLTTTMTAKEFPLHLDGDFFGVEAIVKLNKID